MKLLIIHNYHRSGSPSGDDHVFDNEVNELKKLGHEVITYTAKNDEFDQTGILGKIASAFGMLWSFKHYRAVKRLVKSEKPDIVHVHTAFPLLSPSIFYAAKRGGAKVVQTMHDMRYACPCAAALRGGKVCGECADGRYMRMVKHKCYKNSGIMSLIVAFIFKVHRILGTFRNKIDAYICLNDAQMEMLADAGIDRAKMYKKYNFVFPMIAKNNDSYHLPERFVLYFGRIGEEKGIPFLCKAWEKLDDIPLIAVGDGPLAGEFAKWCEGRKNVQFLGFMPREKCADIVSKSEFVVFPSVFYEGCSMVFIETESLGKPLVASDIGFPHEAVKDGVNGYKFPIGDEDKFCEIVRRLWNDRELIKSLGENAVKDFEQKYSPDENLKQLIQIYELISDK